MLKHAALRYDCPEDCEGPATECDGCAACKGGVHRIEARAAQLLGEELRKARWDAAVQIERPGGVSAAAGPLTCDTEA